MKALVSGHAAGAAGLFDRYHAHVRRVLLHVMGPDAELADLVQEVFVTAVHSIGKLDDPESLRGWLGTISVFTARAKMRHRSRWKAFLPWPSDDLPDVPAEPRSAEVDEAVRATYRVLDRLGAEDRVAFALRFIDGMELSEVAEACEVSLSTMKRRLKRAEERFRRLARREASLVEWLDGSTP